MASQDEFEQIKSFVSRNAGKNLLSTGASLVPYTGVLYNVTGSTGDPPAVPGYKSVSWKKLLTAHGDFSEALCYVEDPPADDGSSHPEFSVGGHMTPNPSGKVETGGISYLIPLCYWHNSTQRDGIAFTLSHNEIVELTGFMEGDTYFTFAPRLTSQNANTLLYFDDSKDEWAVKELSGEEKKLLLQEPGSLKFAGTNSQDFAVFERQGNIVRIAQAKIGDFAV